MGESSITYEELFELLRRERNSEELQTLDPNFYSDLVEYFQDKQSVLNDKSEEAQVFGSSEKEKVRVQLDNAQKIAKELIERREKKIIILALNKARTQSDIIDTSSLLEVEKEFFHESANLFADYKMGVIENILDMNKPLFNGVESSGGSETTSHQESGPEPEPEPKVEPEVSEEEEPTVDLEEDTEEETPAEQGEAGGEETSEEADIEEKEDKGENIEAGRVSVKFKSQIPKFMGKDEEVLGPFEDGETASISEEIAQILIKKGKAEKVEE